MQEDHEASQEPLPIESKQDSIYYDQGRHLRLGRRSVQMHVSNNPKHIDCDPAHARFPDAPNFPSDLKSLDHSCNEQSVAGGGRNDGKALASEGVGDTQQF